MLLRIADRRKRGFGALIAVLLMSSGCAAVSLSVLGAAVAYSDLVFRKELRVQAALNAAACADSAKLAKAKDAFAAGVIRFPEFDCSISL